MDQNPYLLCFNNYVIDIDIGEIPAYSREEAEGLDADPQPPLYR